MVITIDGPVASGKSSVARRLAQRLGFYYLNSGLLYRAAAYICYMTKDNLTSPNIQQITNFTYDYHNGNARIMYNQQDITNQLHTDQISSAASQISSLKQVREALIDMQQNMGKQYDVVTDGRDCGSVIFPHADVKFYLTADVRVRAKRLMADPKRHQSVVALEEVIKQVHERDERDKKRAIAPLVVPDDAVIIDNSHLSQDQTLQLCMQEIKKKGLC